MAEAAASSADSTANASGTDAAELDPQEIQRLKTLEQAIVGIEYLPVLAPYLQRLRQAYDHGNRQLHYDQLLVVHLMAFFNPILRSTRLIEDYTQIQSVQDRLNISTVYRNTFSQAAGLFDATLLHGLMQELRQHIPRLQYRDPDLHQFLKHITPADGTYFTIAADAAWALHHTKINGETQAQIRVDFQIDAEDGTPLCPMICGREDGHEPRSMMRLLAPQTVYLVDRNYVDFDFLNAVLGAGGDFVLRAKANQPSFRATQDLPLTQQDRDLGLVSDQLGHLPGSGGDTPAPPARTLRRVEIFCPHTGERVILITSLLEAPARVIGSLYRHRWQIELFFRWLKCVANVRHLMSMCPNGIAIQFYVAVIAVLLMQLHTKRKPSVYSYSLLSQVACGAATLAEILPIMERRERARHLERERLKRKPPEPPKSSKRSGRKTGR